MRAVAGFFLGCPPFGRAGGDTDIGVFGQKLRQIGAGGIKIQMHGVRPLIQMIGGKRGDLGQAAFGQAYRAPAGRGGVRLRLCRRGGWRGWGVGFAFGAFGAHHAQVAKNPARVVDKLFK